MANVFDLNSGMLGNMGGAAAMTNPWGLAAMGGTAMLPWLLNRFFGGQDPMQQRVNQINTIMSPQNIMRNANTYYRAGIQSPGFQTQLGQIAGTTNNMANVIGNRFAANNPGMDAGRRMGATMMRGNAGLQTGQAYGNLYNTSMNTSLQGAHGLASLLASMGAGPSQSSQLAAGGINAFLPLLFSAMNRSYGYGGKNG